MMKELLHGLLDLAKIFTFEIDEETKKERCHALNPKIGI